MICYYCKKEGTKGNCVECNILVIKKQYKNTSLYQMYMSMYPELFK